MIAGATFCIFTACFDGYERWLPDWEKSIHGMRPVPDEIAIIGDDAAHAAWSGRGIFVLAPEYGRPFRQPAAYNRLLAETRAEWIMHVGVDDLVEPRLLGQVAPYIHRADVIACDVAVEQDGRQIRRRRNRPTRDLILTPTLGGQPLDACAFYKRSFWERSPYDEQIIGGSDVALWIGFAHLGAEFVGTRDVGVHYRLHPDSLWHRRSPENILEVRQQLNRRRRRGFEWVRAQHAGRQFMLACDSVEDHVPRKISRLGIFYERPLLEHAAAAMRGKKGTAVDVGAHIGNHSVFLASFTDLRVLAIEPDPRNVACLRESVRLNQLEGRITTKHTALGPNIGECCIIHPNSSNSGMTQTVGSGSTAASFDVVQLATLDSMAPRDVRLLKIDVEGAECGVLAGAMQTLKRYHPLVYLEARKPEAKAAAEAVLAQAGAFRQVAEFPPATYAYEFTSPTECLIHLSVAIMAHPTRRKFVEELQARLDKPAIAVWDTGNDRWDTGRRSLLAFDPEATHHLVIQDDALVSRDLVAGAAQAIRHHPEHPISLYLGRQRPHGPLFHRLVYEAQQKGASWIRHRQLCWGVALCFPTSMIQPMVEWCDKNDRAQNYDRRLSYYLEAERIWTYYTYPSLVDHRPQHESPSLVPGRVGGDRVAHKFIGTQASALGLRWETPTVTVGRAA